MDTGADGSEFPEELRRAIELRLAALSDLLRRLHGPVPDSRVSLNRALDLLEQFPPAMMAVVAREWDRAADDKLRSDVLGLLLRHLNYVTTFIESYFSHGTRPELSEALVQEIAAELERLVFPSMKSSPHMARRTISKLSMVTLRQPSSDL